jgi:2-iminobutanoate/2-iminopropanoate deaminase
LLDWCPQITTAPDPNGVVTMSDTLNSSAVQTDKAPAAVGPYSQAVTAGGFIFCAGQLPINPTTNEVPLTVAEQTRQSLKNLAAILAAAGTSLDAIVKTTVFLKDMNSFGEMNAVYAEFFGAVPPARSTIEAARLPRDVLVEIEAIALAQSR